MPRCGTLVRADSAMHCARGPSEAEPTTFSAYTLPLMSRGAADCGFMNFYETLYTGAVKPYCSKKVDQQVGRKARS